MKKIIRNFFISKWPHFYWTLKARSQSNNIENKYIYKYSKIFDVDKSFIEFGFSLIEFNCVDIIKGGFKGILIDANLKTCNNANKIFKKLGFNVKAINYWLKIDYLEPIIEFIKENNNKLGILSIDIDGVDYWILKEIYKYVKPELIVVEYNATFGLKQITVPYDENFDRHKYHKSGWYHGASFSAFKKLLEKDYILQKNIEGLNLIFIRKDKKNLLPLKDINNVVYKEHMNRNKISKLNASQQWERIKHLNFDSV